MGHYSTTVTGKQVRGEHGIEMWTQYVTVTLHQVLPSNPLQSSQLEDYLSLHSHKNKSLKKGPREKKKKRKKGHEKSLEY